MARWFRSNPTCPVAIEDKEWIERRFEWLCDEFGRERMLGATVILPTYDYYPDDYHGDEDSARVLLERTCGYLQLDPSTIELLIFDERGGNSNAPKGVYTHERDQFQVWIEVELLKDPLDLVATMAHELCHVHLLGHGRIGDEEPDHEPLTDLTTVFLGMGVFSANSVLREHSWTDGRESGWAISRGGYLSMTQYGYALAQFAWRRDELSPAWAKSLRADVLEPFRKGLRYLTETGGSAFQK